MDTTAVQAGDTAWVLISTALVMLMLPGLALFYAGLVERKNVISTVAHSFIALAIVSVLWVAVGYSMAFGPDIGGIIGNLSWAGMAGVGFEPNPNYSPTVPHLAYASFQMMFAAITPALVTGAFAERKKFGAYLLFTPIWLLAVYIPVAHWVWADGGWLHSLGALDYAGGTVVHLTSGVAALVAAIMLGKRQSVSEPHDGTMTLLGGGLLWFGWFGFNAGSALAANGTAALALLNTNTAAAAAAATWLAISWLQRGRPSAIGAAVGAVAGLVAITPAAGFVTPLVSIFIGIVASVICSTAVQIVRERFGVDDALDVFGVHGIGGMSGALLTGVFASVGGTGLLFGNPMQLAVQALAVAFVALYTVAATYVVLWVVRLLVGLRVDPHEERVGLDVSQHGELVPS